jgi:NAD-dependent deacetylase
VEPAASLCAIAVEAGAALVIVNRDPTPYDRAATAIIRDPIGTAVPQIADQLLAANRA